MQTYASNSEFQYGVIGESEDWHDFHNADNLGPCFSCAILDLDECMHPDEIPGKDCCQECEPADDFEHNDGFSDWEDRSNWYWYNNARANQRGLGGSRYYFEWKDAVKNSGYFDEAQSWRKGVQFQRNHDNGALPQRRFVRGYDSTIRGLFIPADRVDNLVDGELDALFGWYDGDMAGYVRDVLGPRLDDPALTIFEDSVSCAASGLPPAYLIIEQGEFLVTLRNDEGSMTSGAYFGIASNGEPVDADGLVPTDAVYRWSAIYILWEDTDAPPDTSRSPVIDLVPEDGVSKTLWIRDSFARVIPDSFTGLAEDLGYLQLGCQLDINAIDPPDDCWYFVDDLAEEDDPPCEIDWALTLPGGSGPTESWIHAPLNGKEFLNSASGTVYAEIDLNVKDSGAPENGVQIILTRNDAPVAWATVRNGTAVEIGLGGVGLAPVTQAPVSKSGDVPSEISDEPSVYSRIELILDGSARTLELVQDGASLAIHDFSRNDAIHELTVDGLRIWAESGFEGGDNGITLDQIGLLQGLSVMFKRGDVDASGSVDIGDPVSSLLFQFLGDSAPGCLDALDVNDDGAVDIADPLASLFHLFFGNPRPPEPLDDCGMDPTEDSLGCVAFGPCPL
jgi:hypothetical protein